jgi:hypothetical protein
VAQLPADVDAAFGLLEGGIGALYRKHPHQNRCSYCETEVFPGGRKSWPVFNPAEVEFDMQVIARDLHCSAVRITGGDAEKLTVAAEYALAQGP